jgi:drug/metabolite transporter, DME family
MDAAAVEKRERTLAAILTVVAAVLWSGGGVGVKLAHTTALSIAGYRALFALPIMLIEVYRRSRDTTISPWLALRRPRIWAAAVSYATMVIAFVIAAKVGSPANAILIQYSGPIYVALLSWPLLRERMRTADWFAVAGTVTGLLVFFSAEVSADGRLGNLIAMISSFGFGGLPILLRLEAVALKRDGLESAAPMMAVAAMALGNAIAVVIGAKDMLAYPPPSIESWGALVLLGIFQIGLPYVLYGYAVRKLRAVESSLLATIEPIISPLWVYLATGEVPGVPAAIGGTLIVLSVLVPTLWREKVQPA